MTEVEKWLEEGWKLRRLFTYPLNERSVVFDVGALRGGWSYDLLRNGAGVCPHCNAKREPFIHLFEPVTAFYNDCVSRFQDIPKATVHHFGLSSRDYSGNIVVDDAASCLHGPCPWRDSTPKPTELVHLRDIADFVNSSQIDRIDLLTVNIEGEEYDLFDRLVETELLDRVDHFQVQFHDFMPNAAERRNALRTAFARTHRENWCYDFVWESWSKR